MARWWNTLFHIWSTLLDTFHFLGFHDTLFPPCPLTSTFSGSSCSSFCGCSLSLFSTHFHTIFIASTYTARLPYSLALKFWEPKAQLHTSTYLKPKLSSPYFYEYPNPFLNHIAPESRTLSPSQLTTKVKLPLQPSSLTVLKYT